ncbi:cytochrome c-type biogenesis protein [Hyphococcus sp.]|uniref:cytochrome c-type biogenesis protein n=1 Tax=Hyphococcus sp. TaxID=2038636 RepID=UPI002089907B|nr:MAG: cytochrome c-type biogenesis protein CcmH [Marinicaulis sp.]
MMRILIILIALFGVAYAAEPDELLADPALEARAEKIDAHLRCVVCQSQSIAESNAPLAKDLRLLVRERLTEGDTDDQVIAYMVERYGDYVLLKPPVQTNTIFLWSFPFLAFLAGSAGAFLFLRKPNAVKSATPLSDEDEAEIKRLLEERG